MRIAERRGCPRTYYSDRMEKSGVSVREMDRAEVHLAIDWAAREGWNPGLHDAEVFFFADPNGFFVAEVDGKPVGSISAVAYDAAFGFIGLYIVEPALRGKGIGTRLWDAAMRYLGDRNIGLDGVVAMQAAYERSGFKLAYRNIRYRGTGGGEVPSGVTHISEIDFGELVAFDRKMFPAERRAFLAQWLSQDAAAAYTVVQDGVLAGYGVRRICRDGYKIGPLFAATPEVAEDLYCALAAGAAGAPLFLDVPEPNARGRALAARHGMSPVFETARMYTKGEPDITLGQVYGVTTFELG